MNNFNVKNIFILVVFPFVYTSVFAFHIILNLFSSLYSCIFVFVFVFALYFHLYKYLCLHCIFICINLLFILTMCNPVPSFYICILDFGREELICTHGREASEQIKK